MAFYPTGRVPAGDAAAPGWSLARRCWYWAFIAFFTTPSFLAGQHLFGYAMLFYILTGTLDSVINANYGALFPELFRTDASRASTNALRQAFQLVAMIISIALTPLITSKIGFSLTAIIYGILGGSVILYMALTAERSRGSKNDEKKPGLWESLKDLFPIVNSG